MRYMECTRPNGDGRCSYDDCPCGLPGAEIKRGEGYIYVSKEVAQFRSDCPSEEGAQAKLAGMFQGSFVMAPSGTFGPVLMCVQGAKKLDINLTVAAEDAKHWWKTGKVPIRATPKSGEKESSAGCATMIAAIISMLGATALAMWMAFSG